MMYEVEYYGKRLIMTRERLIHGWFPAGSIKIIRQVYDPFDKKDEGDEK